MFRQSPALRVVLLFASGILLAEWILLPPILLYLIVLLVLLFSVILLWFDTWKLTGELSLQFSIILFGLLLQTIEHTHFHSLKLNPIITNEQIAIFGTIDSEPVLQERRISCVVQVDSIIRRTKVERESRRIMTLIRLAGNEHYAHEIQFGNKANFRGNIEPFPFQRNPFEYDYGKYLELNNIQGIVSVKGLINVQVKKAEEGNSIQTRRYSLQSTLYRIIDKLHSPRHASFLKGIIFGYRAEIPLEVKQSFMDTGTIHILAVSGSNVAFVALIFISLFGFFRLPRKVIVIAAIFGLVVYMIITGSSASVVRATVMAVVFICGGLFERKANIYNSISVAALILLLWNTNNLFDIGFQLSFAAVISIVYFYPRLESLIKMIPERFEEIKAVDVVLKLFAVSLAAQIGTIPFTAHYFGRASIISLIANIPVVPISGLNTFLGVAEIFFFPVSSWISQMYAAVNDFLVWFLLGFVREAASAPFAYIETSHLNMAVAVVYYTILVCIFNFNNKRIRNLMFIIILVMGNYFIYDFILSNADRKMTVTVIDVGQGDAILVEFPKEKRILVDTGPSSLKYDSGERIVVPFLKHKGITHLDYLLITHPHNDHLGGVLSILKFIRIDTLILNYGIHDNRMTTRVLETARERNIGIRSILSGDQIPIDPNARIYVLHPDEGDLRARNKNNSSIMLKVLYGNTSILLAGDAEISVEEKVVPRYNQFLKSSILKVAHHGSNTGTTEKFLSYIEPNMALVSVGIHNKFHHPSPYTIRRLKAHSIGIDRTDRSGAIILETDGKLWLRKEWRSSF